MARPSRVEMWRKKVENNRLLSVVIVLAAVIIALGNLTDAFESLSRLLRPRSTERIAEPTPTPSPTPIRSAATEGCKYLFVGPIEPIEEQVLTVRFDGFNERFSRTDEHNDVFVLKDYPPGKYSMFVSSVTGRLARKEYSDLVEITGALYYSFDPVNDPYASPGRGVIGNGIRLAVLDDSAARRFLARRKGLTLPDCSTQRVGFARPPSSLPHD